ncbi:serine protease inhibitor Kazal-type 1-like [Rattus rattus]|uniref:serine protease inhibitor Kazal-type 1-like n=1 Tax=Rattus rattus TaxID=10117 RepID=UPI0013F3937F|nr:serine protease inhibitor Kazal-type 1-like [Rattus rattus]
MKVAIIFLLSALALLSLAGNPPAEVNRKTPNCPKEIMGCPRIYDPVCGTNGITYPSECSLCFENRWVGVSITALGLLPGYLKKVASSSSIYSESQIRSLTLILGHLPYSMSLSSPGDNTPTPHPHQ